MGRLLLFEGYDGSGKSTLIDNFDILLKQNNKTSLIVGRGVTQTTTNITFALKDNESILLPATDILLRLARETEKISFALKNLSGYDYVLFDRSILSAVSWINYYSEDWRKYAEIIDSLFTQLNCCDLIYCYLPFEDSWNRVIARGSLSKKELAGKEINQKMYDALRSTFLAINYPNVNKHEIDTSQNKKKCLINLLDAIKFV